MNDEKTSPKKAEVRGQRSEVSAIDDRGDVVEGARAPSNNAEVRGQGSEVGSELETRNSKLETAVTRVRFAPAQESPTLEIGNGEYHRVFEAKDQPFACKKDEAAMLLRTGHFVEDV